MGFDAVFRDMSKLDTIFRDLSNSESYVLENDIRNKLCKIKFIIDDAPTLKEIFEICERDNHEISVSPIKSRTTLNVMIPREDYAIVLEYDGASEGFHDVEVFIHPYGSNVKYTIHS